jgi:phenylacetic acid degradation operon negative regulatory protein
MRKISIKKAILLGLASVLDEAIDWWEIANSPYLYLKYSHLKKHSVANVVSNLLKTGYLEKKTKNGEVVYRLTSWGETKILYDIPLARYTGKKWDGIWRLVSFDVPEKKASLRVWLRDKLRELGFGMLQESLWIIPHDLGQALAEFMEHEGLSEYVIVWEGKKIFGEDEKELAKRVWKLEDLHRRYLDFILKFEKIVTNKEETKKQRVDWEEEYFSLLMADPGLPKELVLDDWLFERARQLFRKLRNQVQ